MESVVAFFEQRAVEVVGREIPQILLIHASQLNADLMPDLLAMFKRRGYSFVTLRQALADPAYSLPESYVGEGDSPGFTAGRRRRAFRIKASRTRPPGLKRHTRFGNITSVPDHRGIIVSTN